MLHRSRDGQYTTGRHSSGVVNKVLDDGLFIVWFGWSPMRYVTSRKLQIQQRTSARDRAARLGWHHNVTPEELETMYLAHASRAYDLWDRHPAYHEMVKYLAAKQMMPFETR